MFHYTKQTILFTVYVIAAINLTEIIENNILLHKSCI